MTPIIAAACWDVCHSFLVAAPICHQVNNICCRFDLNPTKRVIRVSAMRSKKVTGTLQTHHSFIQLRMFRECWDRLQNVSTQTGVVDDLLTILRFHCKHYDSKEATVGLHFLIKFISLKRTWNAKSWHLKWKFAKLPPIPHNAILLSPPPPSNAITIFSFHTNDFWSKYFLPPRVRLWSVVNKQYFVDAPPPSLQLSYITVPGRGGGGADPGWQMLAPSSQQR